MKSSLALLKSLLPLAILVALAACQPPAPRQPGTPGPKKSEGVNPEACGDISKHDVGRKAHAFLVASAELDRASLELEGTVHKACEAMASAMLISTDGDTKTLCERVDKELKSSLEVSISQEQRLVTRTVPPVCTTEIDFTADVVAKCEAKIAADISVRCEGQCGAVCNGACDGECSATAADGSCAGTCNGVCQGSCTGTCEGSAYVDASAECKASAEIQASVHTECTEAKVEVVTENVTVVDASRLERAVEAIKVGLPILLQMGAKAKLIAKAFVHWSKTAVSLAGASGRLFKDLGARGVCVGVQLAAAVAASANISARVEVSIEVSASVSASAGSES
jgi:hypothetical protein